MDELERMLRGDRSRLGHVDSRTTLGGVLASGRRRRLRRRAAGAGVSTAATVVAVALTPLATSLGVSVDEVVGAGVSDVGSASASPTPSANASTPPSEPAQHTAPPVVARSTEPSDRPSPTASPTTPAPTPVRVPLTLTVTTDDDRYAQGEDVTIVVRACNATDDVHEEWFADPRWRFRVQVITEDDRNIAFGQYERRDEQSTERWAPGACRDYTIAWDQSEGPFEEDGGQQAWEGEHRIELSWWGVAPPPEGMDPGLYDPVGRESVWSPPFTIEPAPTPRTPGLGDVP